MQAHLWFSLGALALGVAGCAAKKVPPPPLRTIELGGLKADYRNYAKADVCSMDAAALEQELESMRILLAEFLGQTSAGFEGAWSEEHVALLAEGAKSLPAVLTQTQAAVETLPNCPRLHVPSGPPVAELIRQTRARLREAPILHAYVSARMELARWKDAQPEAQAQGKAQCPKKEKLPSIYYGAEDERGNQLFLFCDGTRVQRTVGSGTSVQTEKPGKKLTNEAYEALLPKFPADQIQRAPRLPSKVAKKGAQQEDRFDLESQQEP